MIQSSTKSSFRQCSSDFLGDDDGDIQHGSGVVTRGIFELLVVVSREFWAS